MSDHSRIDDLRRRVHKDPASIAFAQLAEELRRAGHYQESIDACRAGLALHPGYLSARVTLGRALLELNQLEPAQVELELVLRSAPENLAAIRGLGEIHHRRGELAQALAQYRAALALARNDPELEQTVAELSREVEPQKPAKDDDGLSFDQMQDELLKHMTLPGRSSAPATAAPLPPAVPEPEGEPESPATVAAPAALPSPEPEILPPPRSTEAPDALGSFTAHDRVAIFASPPRLRPVAEVAVASTPLPSRHGRPSANHEHDTVPLVDGSGEMPTAAAREHAARTIAALEQWLEAVHVARAHRRA
jgi:hypothetical protein